MTEHTVLGANDMKMKNARSAYIFYGDIKLASSIVQSKKTMFWRKLNGYKAVAFLRSIISHPVVGEGLIHREGTISAKC